MMKKVTSENFVEEAMRTRYNLEDLHKRVQDLPDKRCQLISGVIGINSEGGELLAEIGNFMYQGKPIDEERILSEMGDLLWRVAEVCDSLDVSLEDVMLRVIVKLRTRYPTKFSEFRALKENRNEALEEKIASDALKSRSIARARAEDDGVNYESSVDFYDNNGSE